VKGFKGLRTRRIFVFWVGGWGGGYGVARECCNSAVFFLVARLASRFWWWGRRGVFVFLGMAANRRGI